MSAALPVTAASRSVALRFEPDSDLLAGSLLRLTTSPQASATAKTVEGSDPTAAVATARGIGAGYSSYYAGLVDAEFFNSRNLSIASGGGSVDGEAIASALASGRGDTEASAQAINVGLANLSYLDRYGGALLIGTSARPFTATATAASDSVLGPLPGATPTSSLNATAVVRGLEGSGELAYRQPLRLDGQRLDTRSILASQAPSGPIYQPLVVSGSGNTPLLDLSGSGGLATVNVELFRSASASNTLGFYRVIDREGTVRRADGVLLKPSDSGYAAAALAPDNLVTELQGLSLPESGSISRAVVLDETGYLAPFATLRTQDPTGIQVFGFNDPAAFDHFLALSGSTIAIEDLRPPFSSEEPDYNDINVSLGQPARQPLPVLDLRDSDGSYTTTFTLQRNSSHESVFGYYRVLDVNGAVRAADGRVLLPGATDYQQEALRPDNLVSELQGLQVPAGQSSAEFTVGIDETSLIVPFARVSPPGQPPYTSFVYPSANGDAVAAFLTSGQSAFGFEELRLSDPARDLLPGEPDFNDTTVSVGPFEQTTRPLVLPTFTIYGQPNATVAAKAQLLAADGSGLQGSATADARGIDRYQIKAVPQGNGDGTASITGEATATLQVDGSVRSGAPPVSLNGQAIGIDSSLIYGAPSLNTTISGRGVTLVEVSDPAGMDLQQLKGVGITNSMLFTNQGNDLVRGIAGIAAPGLNLPAGASSDAAGIDRTGIYTGIGNDVIFGKVLNEIEADFDADGDGIKEAGVYLDRSAEDGSVGGFDGLRRSTANTGIGNDLIAGSSNGSHLFGEIGNDSIDLDRAKSSSLWGGIGNDLLRINGPSRSNVLWGGVGNDAIEVLRGSGNVLDGGYGQDLITSGKGQDRVLFSEGGAAITAATSSSFGEQLTELPFWASLSQSQKDGLWDTGVLRDANGQQVFGGIDTVRNFTAGSSGDVMEISSSLASITQELWQNKGALYGVSGDGKLNVIEASADGSNRLGVVVGSLADIHRLGIGSPSIAYATDTRQLMFDSDGNWSDGAISLGTVNVSGSLTKSNFAFGATTGNGLGPSRMAQGGVV